MIQVSPTDTNCEGRTFAEIDAEHEATKARVFDHFAVNGYVTTTDEDVANVACLIECRGGLVRKMARQVPFGRIWNEISKEITDIDADLAVWGLV